MRLDSLVGNAGLKEQLSAQCAGRGLSHAYLISGPEGSGKRTLARLMAAAMVCSGGGEPPCGWCIDCKKVREGVHPDVITVDVPTGKREILADQARQIRADAIIRPNEAARKVYIIHHAQTMNRSAQNAILKILEEGPAYAAFLLLTDNPVSMLPTVRSRCEMVALSPVSQTDAQEWLSKHFPDKSQQELRQAAIACGGVLGRAVEKLTGTVSPEMAEQAEELLAAFAARDELALMAFCGALEQKKLPRDALCALLDAAANLLRDALVLPYGAEIHAGSEQLTAVRQAAQLPQRVLLKAADAVQKLRWDADFNVNTANLCAALCALLGEALSETFGGTAHD